MAMEHRWGRRLPLDTNVTLNSRPAGRSRGRLRNISSGGAFVQSRLPLAIHAPVELVLASGFDGATRIHRFDAVVSRVGHNGVGLMFIRFNPNELTALLARFAAGATAPPASSSPNSAARRRRRSETQ